MMSGIVFLSTVFALLTMLFSHGVNAQAIPYDFEPERVAPQTRIRLPSIRTVPEAVDYFFEPGAHARNLGATYPVVHMRIPKAPYFRKDASSGPVRSYRMHITMFYPNFSGLADAENFECHADAMIAAGKAGHCRRELTVAFEYAPKRHLSTSYEQLQADMARSYVKPATERSRYPDLELVGVDMNDPDNQYYRSRTTFYVSRNPITDQPELVISCLEYVPSPSCTTSFRATRSPYINIELSFVLSLLEQWQEVIDKTRKKVDSMIVETYELPRPGAL